MGGSSSSHVERRYCPPAAAMLKLTGMLADGYAIESGTLLSITERLEQEFPADKEGQIKMFKEMLPFCEVGAFVDQVFVFQSATKQGEVHFVCAGFRKVNDLNIDFLLLKTVTEFQSSQGHIDIRDYNSHPIFQSTKNQVE